MPPSNFTDDLPTEREPPVIREDSGNGFIWHTTGSGKTLTSFNASTLLNDNPEAKSGCHDRKQKLFIDARKLGTLIDRLPLFPQN